MPYNQNRKTTKQVLSNPVMSSLTHRTAWRETKEEEVHCFY